MDMGRCRAVVRTDFHSGLVLLCLLGLACDADTSVGTPAVEDGGSSGEDPSQDTGGTRDGAVPDPDDASTPSGRPDRDAGPPDARSDGGADAGGGNECEGQPDDTPCGTRMGQGECDRSDVCRDGVCTANHRPEGTACGDREDRECDGPDVCDGAGNCVPNYDADTEPCGDTGDECVQQDFCDGNGSCEDNGFVAAGTACTDSDDNECTIAQCDGSGACDQDADDAPTGTDCGLCAECNGSGVCDQVPADDSACGTIECDGLDSTCRDYDDLTANRCEGLNDCKDDDTADCDLFDNTALNTSCGDCQVCDGNGACGNEPADGDLNDTCGLCEVCDGSGGCTDAAVDTDVKDECSQDSCNTGTCDGSGACGFEPVDTGCGLCSTCDGAGACDQVPADDDACGEIDCDLLDDACRNYADLTTQRCSALGECKAPNTVGSCTAFVNSAVDTRCGDCQVCDGAGSCGNVVQGLDTNDDCPDCEQCDGAGGCEDVAANTDTLGDCGNCELCDGSGACTNVPANTDPLDDCLACEVCDGAGLCENTASGTDPLDDCAPCEVCDGAGLCTDATTDTDPKDDCSPCEACDGAGSCFEVRANTDPLDDCDDCQVCDGAGSCENAPANTDPVDDCSDCQVCNGLGVCESAVANTDPADDCSVCQVCDGLGLCEDAAANTDPVDDCLECQVCDGSGFCEDAAVNTDPVDDCLECEVCDTGACVPAAVDTDPVDDCTLCQVCDGTSACVDVTTNTDPLNECGTCAICDGAGACEDASLDSDPKDQCGTCAACDGLGACATALEGDDPKDQCDPDACNTGACDGSGACGFEDAGTSCGLCEACDGAGTCDQTPADDANCGDIDCDDLDVTCRNYHDLMADRCASFGACKAPNDAGTCTSFTNADDDLDCGLCQVCTSGVCSDEPSGQDLTDDCELCNQCDGSGGCELAPDGTDPKDQCDQDTDVCDTGNCDGAGGCGFVPAGDACDDTDGEICTIPQCDGAGGCDQSRAFEPEGTSCDDTTADCLDARCDGSGACDQRYTEEPDALACDLAPAPGMLSGSCSDGVCCPGLMISSPDGCIFPDPELDLLFVSDQPLPVVPGPVGLGAFDAHCQQAALDAGIAHPTSFRAIMSDSQVPVDTIVQRLGDGPYARVDIELVALDLVSPTGGILVPGPGPGLAPMTVPIELTELNLVSQFPIVVTGSNPQGLPTGQDCVGYSDPAAQVTVGDPFAPGLGAFEVSVQLCDPSGTGATPLVAPIYCARFEDCPGLRDIDFDTDADHCGGCGRRCDSDICTAGECEALVFTTSLPAVPGTAYSGTPGTGMTFNSVADADAICTDLAVAAGLLSEYRAWLSMDGSTGTAVDAVTRLVDRSYMMRVPGPAFQPIATSLGALTGTGPVAPIDHDEAARPVVVGPDGPYVWTGTDPSGVLSIMGACTAWTSSSAGDTGAVGDFSAAPTAMLWSELSPFPCAPAQAVGHHFYCFEHHP